MDEALLNPLGEIITERTAAHIVILFGSAAQNGIREDSDYDFAFLSDKIFSEYEVCCIAQELSSRANRDVDLIDLRKASTVFKANIVGTGNVI